MSNEMKTNKPKGYVIYPDQWKALKGLSLARLGRVFKAVYETLNGVEGAEKELKGSVRIAYDFLRVQFDMDVEKYDQLCERNRIKAKKRWEKHKNAKNATACLAMHNENENENENDTNSSVVSEKKEGSIAAKEISGKSANFDTAAAWQQNFIKTFNELIAGSNIPPVRRLSAKRMDKLRVIWREFSTKDLAEVVRKAAASDFLNGRGTKHYFQATFDWLIEPENFLKVLEGTYR